MVYVWSCVFYSICCDNIYTVVVVVVVVVMNMMITTDSIISLNDDM